MTRSGVKSSVQETEASPSIPSGVRKFRFRRTCVEFRKAYLHFYRQEQEESIVTPPANPRSTPTLQGSVVPEGRQQRKWTDRLQRTLGVCCVPSGGCVSEQAAKSSVGKSRYVTLVFLLVNPKAWHESNRTNDACCGPEAGEA